MEININTQDILKKGLKLNQLETDIPIYDKYSLTFTLNNGERKTIFLYADKNSIAKNTPIEGKVRQFFLGFILENSNIRYDRFYLGSFNSTDDEKTVNNKYSSADNGFEDKQSQFDSLVEMFELLESGKISQQELEETFPEIYRQTQFSEKTFKEALKIEKSEPVLKAVKHYALGAIHGSKEAYDTAMGQLEENDSIVILGDVIDRGNDGIEILLDLIKRQANNAGSNVKFIMGNHELMMLEAIEVINKYNLQLEEIKEISRFGQLTKQIEKLRKRKEDKSLSMEERDRARGLGLTLLKSNEWQTYISKYAISERNLFENGEVEIISDWLSVMNGGFRTFLKYKELPENLKTQIQEFLRESYIAYNQTVQGENKLYVHARPLQDTSLIRKLKGRNNKGIRYSEVSKPEAEFSVWNREIDTFTQYKEEGFTTICGHKPGYNISIIDIGKGTICLDEGCGHGKMYTTGLYCIEDGTILHINEMGKIDNENGKIKVIDEEGEEQVVSGNKIPEKSRDR